MYPTVYQRLKHMIGSTSFLEVLFLCFIIAITFWGYYGALDDFFIMDDFDMIRAHSTLKQFVKHWSSPVGANSYRPLADLSFMWDFYPKAEDPASYVPYASGYGSGMVSCIRCCSCFG